MEILTWVLEGRLAHKDSSGGEGEIGPGELQKMSAGTGIRHSEFNPSHTEGLRLLQMWILPEKDGLEPSYEQRHFPLEDRRNRWKLIAAEHGRDGAIPIYQKADLYTAVLDEGAPWSIAQGKGVSFGCKSARRSGIERDRSEGRRRRCVDRGNGDDRKGECSGGGSAVRHGLMAG